MPRPILVIAGMGEGFGIALAQTFAADGFDIAGVARTVALRDEATRRVASLGGRYHHLLGDVSEPGALDHLLAPLNDRIRAAIHNTARLVVSEFGSLDAETFETTWRVAALGGFNLAQAVLPGMRERGTGTLIFSGATASQRGGRRFAAFASAKFAVRGLAQCLAREYGPAGIHVAHVIIDGLIDAPQSDARFGPATGPRLSPDAVARAYLQLVRQERSAFTHELDLRPASETF